MKHTCNGNAGGLCEACAEEEKNQPEQNSDLNDLLECKAIIEAIDSISEYDNPILFRKELLAAFLEKGISIELTTDLTDMICDLMRVAVKRTKQEMRMKTMAL